MIERLRWYAGLSAYFKLSESPHQMAQRPWWDVLSMNVLVQADQQEQRSAPPPRTLDD